MKTEGTSNGNWIHVKERRPTAEDADPQGCVLVWHIFQGLMLTGWRQVANNRFMVYWQTPIEPPKEAERLRKEWNEEIERSYLRK